MKKLYKFDPLNVSSNIIAVNFLTISILYLPFLKSIYGNDALLFQILVCIQILAAILVLSKMPKSLTLLTLLVANYLGVFWGLEMFAGWYNINIFFLAYLVIFSAPCSHSVQAIKQKSIVFIFKFHIICQYLWLFKFRVDFESWFQGVEIFRVIGNDILSFLPASIVENKLSYQSIKAISKVGFIMESFIPLLLFFNKMVPYVVTFLIIFHLGLMLTTKLFWWQSSMIAYLYFISASSYKKP